MSKRESKSDRKRQCESENGPSQLKVQRLLAISPSSTKITDLNDNCLEKIFKHLNLRSLFNVAVANAYLRPTAGVVCMQKYGKNIVAIMNEVDYSRSTPLVRGKQTNIKNLRTCLQYLRCLGSSISNLRIFYHGWNDKQCDHIHQYLNQYCAKTLASIRFVDKPAGKAITHIEKPFVSVHAVEVSESDLDAQIASFSEWFPNMRSLSLDYVYVDPRYFIDMPFPHLVDVNIELLNKEHDIAQNFTTRLLQQCPQLHSLKFCSRSGEEVSLKTILKITEGCQSIRNLKVGLRKTHVTLSDVQQLVDAHPWLVQLQLYGYKFSVEAVQLIIRQLNSLEQFQFQFHFADRLMYSHFVSQLDNQWQPLSTVEVFGDCFIELKRRL